MAYNVYQKLSDNISALHIALKSDNAAAIDSGALETLQKFSGFGGIKAILYPNAPIEEWEKLNASDGDLRLYHPMLGLHELLENYFNNGDYKEVIDSLKHSVLTAFYTPPVIPRTLFSLLKEKRINPGRIYEPSAGAGIFISEAIKTFPRLQKVTAVEKDVLSAKVLQAISSHWQTPSTIYGVGFEQTTTKDNCQYDLIVSNIPFGNFKIFDPAFANGDLTNKIHNYFFAKGLDKIGNGGLLAYITTDGFLNSPSNRAAREYLFSKADFVSLTVMPDNLMKNTGNTEAPSHLLIVQKNENKQIFSADEMLLLETEEQQNEFGTYHLNQFISTHATSICMGDEIIEGKNQYGAPHRQIWQNKAIDSIAEPLHKVLSDHFELNFNPDAFRQLQQSLQKSNVSEVRKLTYLVAPQKQEQPVTVQLGMFDTAPVENINRAMDYLTSPDLTIIEKATARVIGVLKTSENPEHESIVQLTAKARTNNNYYYKLYSNLKEIDCSGKWVNADKMQEELERVKGQLSEYGVNLRFDGERMFSRSFDSTEQHQDYFTDLKPHYREGTLVFHNGLPGTIHKIDIDNNRSEFQSFAIRSRVDSFYQQYIKVRDIYFELSAHEIASGVAYPELRDELNTAYDRFIVHHGLLNQPANRKALYNDGLGFIALSSLERKEGEKFVKADIFFKPLFKEKEVFTTTDPVEALARSLNDLGAVNIDFIAKATDRPAEEAIHLLEGHILLEPVSRQWQSSDKYLSGNVVLKLAQAKKAVEENTDDPQLQRSLQAIEKVQPQPIPFELLDFNFGERWMPVEYYNRFASHLFDQNVTVHFLGSVDSFKVSAESDNAKVSTEYAVTGRNGKTLKGNLILEHALENTAPFITYKVTVNGEEVSVPDNDAIQLANQKIELIRSKYVEWLKELPSEDKKNIERLYNETFNCYVLRQYNGSHLRFPGLDKYALGIVDLYDSQKNAAWRIIQDRGALIDHEVGLGKTLTMIVAAHEMKRLGIAEKPMIIGLKANIPDIAATYRKAYPNDRILFPGEDDFSPANRQRLFHSIKSNNWDCIIITHDQFAKIPQSAQIQQKILQQELDNLELDLDTMKQQGGQVSKQILKGLEIRKNNLKASLKDNTERIESKKDRDIDFEQLGIDHLFVDEAHKFKNLTFTTRHNRVAGLGNTSGSQRALNMLFAVRTLQDRFNSDLCVTFLTGTPISNSLTELYLIFKYLRPNEMRRQQIENFDAWAAVFAKKTVDFEFSVTNEIIAKERFRHFIKVPELALFYNEITDYKTAKHIKLDKPALEEILVNLKPTSDQQEFIQNLIAFAKTADGNLIGRGQLTKEEEKGKMLIATNYAKKMAVDMRLIDESKYEDHPRNKISACCQKVAEIYQQSSPHRGTQIIFCDLGTPKPGQFNVYDELRRKLVAEHGIAAGEIVFIHDWEGKRPQLFKMMNSGRIRVLLGSTDKAGTGVNVQERVVASHHLDIPWTPKDLEQRNGRGARQGNIIAKQFYDNKVTNFIYATEQSLDNYKFSLLKNKITFISQMKNGELSIRSIDEGAIDKDSGMNFSEYIAILSGDTTLLEKTKVEKQIAVLESLKVVHQKQAATTRYKLESLEQRKETLEKTVAKLSADEQWYQSQLHFTKEGAKQNPIQLIGFNSADPSEIGKHLTAIYRGWSPADAAIKQQRIGSLYGFDLFIKAEREIVNYNDETTYRYRNSFYACRGNDSIKYTYSNGMPSLDNPSMVARHFLNAIDRVSVLHKQYKEELAQVMKDLPVVQKIISNPFEKEEDLKSLKLELSRLEKDIALKVQAKQTSETASHQEKSEAVVISMDQNKKKDYSRPPMRIAC